MNPEQSPRLRWLNKFGAGFFRRQVKIPESFRVSRVACRVALIRHGINVPARRYRIPNNVFEGRINVVLRHDSNPNSGAFASPFFERNADNLRIIIPEARFRHRVEKRLLEIVAIGSCRARDRPRRPIPFAFGLFERMTPNHRNVQGTRQRAGRAKRGKHPTEHPLGLFATVVFRSSENACPDFVSNDAQRCLRRRLRRNEVQKELNRLSTHAPIYPAAICCNAVFTPDNRPLTMRRLPL